MAVAQSWFEIKKTAHINSKTKKDIWNSLESHLLPHIGKKQITELMPTDIKNALQSLE